MNVSYEKILQKMEQEIAAAKHANGAELERHAYAIKSLCDLLLGLEKTPASAKAAAPAPSVIPPAAQQPVQVVGQQERIAAEDGSNGESIFDF
ncbi:YwdI family protein [Domibacillus indicus]|uniref:YwdI family protein n=1 Tax=Domibacillus indicus TaxID=1437523 RepID=UPI0006182BAB|nr:YwdI family protein [Domibacillus indicus]